MSSKFKKTQKNKLFKAVLSLLCILCLSFSFVLPASAETYSAEIQEAANGLVQVRMIYKKNSHDSGTAIKGGTGFLINSGTVLTCAHVVDIDDEVETLCKGLYGNDYSADNLSLEVVVSGDVTIEVTIKKESQDMDFAILNLTDVMNKRSPIALGDSDITAKTDTVYAIGFPQSVAELQNKNTFTSDDVTVTSGTVSKNTSAADGVDYIQHSATLTDGNSGGPLVNEEGAVVGINKGSSTDYNYAISINQVKDVLDELAIEYTSSDSSSVESETESEEEEVVTEEVVTEPVITEAATEAVTEATESAAGTTADNTKMIIIIAIVALVVILVIVVVVILVSGKKKKAPPQIPATQRVTPPQQSNNQHQPFAVSAPPQMPPFGGPSAPTVPSNDGAGETSVLNDGAGETTVLGFQSTGAMLVRARTHENININKPEFIIGKERRRVDYCIKDNNSVSRIHAKIKVRAGKYYISDLGSTNCTYVNGNKLSPNQEIALSSGDKIKISDEEFEFKG